jgi:glycosyltransferase involved in cell wall biosynthesis
LQYLGFVPDEHLGVLYKHAAWFLFPSIYEGFGLPAVEAMANGCPVLAARSASLPEVCGNAAIYFDPHDGNALGDLLQSLPARADDRRRLLDAAAGRLKLYTWTANARIVLDEIVAVLGLNERSGAAYRDYLREQT